MKRILRAGDERLIVSLVEEVEAKPSKADGSALYMGEEKKSTKAKILKGNVVDYEYEWDCYEYRFAKENIVHFEEYNGRKIIVDDKEYWSVKVEDILMVEMSEESFENESIQKIKNEESE